MQSLDPVNARTKYAQMGPPQPQSTQYLQVPQVTNIPPSPSGMNSVHGDALKKLLYTAIIGAGAGAGFRGLTGILGALSGPSESPRSHTQPTIIEVPYPRRRDEKKMGSVKSANIFLNPGARSPSEIPLMWPAAVLAATGSGVAGYKLMDWLAKKRKENVLNTELEDSRKRYHRALVGQYVKPQVKSSEAEEEVDAGPDIDNAEAAPGARAMDEYAGEDSVKSEEEIEAMEEGEEKDACYDALISRELDKLYDKFQAKQADWKGFWPRTLGAYLALAGATAAGTGLLAYNMTGRRDPKRLVHEAIKARERDAFMRRPREVFVRPVPVDVERGKEKKQLAKAIDRTPTPAY